MTEPDGPVPLRAGALRALLRQPDLPPDLIAKVSARADHLDRAEQRDAGVRGRYVPWSRLPIIVAILMAFIVAGGIAFTLFPVPPEAGFNLPSTSEDAPPPMPEVPMEATPPAMDVRPQPDADAAEATPAANMKEEARPASPAAHVPSVASGATARAGAPQPGAVGRPANAGGPSNEGAVSQRHGLGAGGSRLAAPAPASTPPAAVAPLAGDITPPVAREAAPPVTVDVPVAVPVIDLSAQP